jgi:hypothetical protein
LEVLFPPPSLRDTSASGGYGSFICFVAGVIKIQEDHIYHHTMVLVEQGVATLVLFTEGRGYALYPFSFLLGYCRKRFVMTGAKWPYFGENHHFIAFFVVIFIVYKVMKKYLLLNLQINLMFIEL